MTFDIDDAGPKAQDTILRLLDLLSLHGTHRTWCDGKEPDASGYGDNVNHCPCKWNDLKPDLAKLYLLAAGLPEKKG